MASPDMKHYHDEEHSSKYLSDYCFTRDTSMIEECLGFPVRKLHEIFSKGHLKVDKVLDISYGSVALPFFSVSNVCKEIYVIKLNKDGMDQINQWLEKSDQATDWSYVARRVCHLERNRQPWQEKEEQARKAVKAVLLWDNHEMSGVDPSLVPEVDCVLSLWLLSSISKTKEEFVRNLKHFTSRLKCGGHLVLVAGLNMTFYRVGDHRFFYLTVNEADIQEMVIKAGFVIKQSETHTSVDPCDIADFKHLYFVLACKESED